MKYNLKKEQTNDSPIATLYNIITRDGFISQTQYLALWPENTDRESAMLELYKMEQEGLIYGNYASKNPTFYLAEIVRH